MVARRSVSLLLLLSALSVLSASPLVGQSTTEVLPPEVEGIGVDQQLDAQLPLDLRFKDAQGRSVRLGDLFRDGRPVVLSLVYYRCPMLCGLVLDGMVNVLGELDWAPGGEFDVITVSIDPNEKPTLARAKKQSVLGELGKPGAELGWHFLTGDREAIASLADTVGFRYRYLRDQREYAHPAALFVITPEGRVSRYLFGVRHDPRTVRLSLVEAAEGRIGSVVDAFLLYCYRYDSVDGKYSPVAWRLMRVAGVGTAVVLGGVLIGFWRREARRKRVA